jgi:hypothetical protein
VCGALTSKCRTALHCAHSLGRTMAGPTCEFGVFGMGVMGQNLALNIAERGYKLAAYNRPDEFQVGNAARLIARRLAPHTA